MLPVCERAVIENATVPWGRVPAPPPPNSFTKDAKAPWPMVYLQLSEGLYEGDEVEGERAGH